MTLMAWRTFIMPELTKPTVITAVAQEDWITAVTPVPSSTPRGSVLDRRYRIGSSLLPDTFFSPSPIRLMPNRNSAMPLRREMTSDTVIDQSPPFICSLENRPVCLLTYYNIPL